MPATSNEIGDRVVPCAPSHSSTTNSTAERDLPQVIVRAIARVMTFRGGFFSRLDRSDRCALIEVVRCISKDRPRDPVFIRRDTLAVRLDCSLATVTRTLARLEELGWIVRDQVKSRIRGFQVGSICLSDEAFKLLGFDTQEALRQSPMTDACSISFKQSLKRQPEHVGPSDFPRAKVPAKQGTASLPSSLSWLLSGMTPWAVCKLMSIARSRGVMLEVVTNQCQKQIQAAQNMFAYVKTLLKQDKDWAYIAQQSSTNQEAETQKADEHRKWEEQKSALEGKSFIGGDGVVRRVSEGAVTLFSLEEACKPLGMSQGSRPITEAFVQAISDGRLVGWSKGAQSSSLPTATGHRTSELAEQGRGELHGIKNSVYSQAASFALSILGTPRHRATV